MSISKYIELTKPGITRMQLITVSIGYFSGLRWVSERMELIPYVYLLIGTLFISAAAASYNHIMERDEDQQMARTEQRPMVTGQIHTRHAHLFSALLLVIGSILLFQIHHQVLMIGLTTVFLYVGVYTPLKRKSWLNTLVGAVPGALPIVGGWFAATTHLDFAVWPLFAVLFAWQMPHFYALAVMYKDDYAKSNFQMLPVIDPGLHKTSQQVLIYAILTVLASIWPVLYELMSPVYGVLMLLLGLGFLALSIRFSLKKDLRSAKQLFYASIIYLPLWFIAVMIDLLFL